MYILFAACVGEEGYKGPLNYIRNFRGRIAFIPCSGVRLKEVMKGAFDILICADFSYPTTSILINN